MSADAPVEVTSVDLEGVDRDGRDPAATETAGLERVRAAEAVPTAAEGTAIFRALAEQVRPWFADSGCAVEAYMTWHNATHGWSDPDRGTVRRQYSRVSFIAHAPATGVTGKSGVCLPAGLATMDPVALRDAFERAVAQAKRLASGAPLRGMAGSLVLSPIAAGTFVHEVIGHLCEADNALLAESPALGRRLTRAPITVRDGPHDPRGWGATVVDDEATTTELTTIVADGVIAGYVHDRRTAGAKSNGHGRRSTFRDHAYPRLTQVGLTPGDDAPDDLVGSVKSGVYVDTFGYGYLHPRSGRTRLVIREAHRIADGVITDAVISGGELRLDAYRALEAVTGVGRDVVWSPALCLKRRQELPVLNGGATLLLDPNAVAVGSG